MRAQIGVILGGRAMAHEKLDQDLGEERDGLDRATETPSSQERADSRGGSERLPKTFAKAGERVLALWSKLRQSLSEGALSEGARAEAVSSVNDHHVAIRGAVCRVQDDELEDPVFNARVTHRLTNVLDTSDEQGQFELRILKSQLLKDRYLWVLPPKSSRAFYPRRVKIGRPDLNVDLQKGETALFPILLPESIQRVPGAVWSLGLTFETWRLSGVMKRLLMCLVIPLIGVVAIDAGTPVPFTDYDDHLRETLQRTPYYPSFRPQVTYSEVRSVYHSGISYRLRSGDYDCTPHGILVEDNAKLTIDAGTKLSMPEGASIHVSGVLKAQGESDRKIVVRGAGDARWNNIVFEGHNSQGSVLRHCEIIGGGGTPSQASDTGQFDLVESGSAVGGALLVYDTSIHVEHSTISDCTARFGGGVYIRNPPSIGDGAQTQLPGSIFHDVVIQECVATDPDRAGGGAIFVKSAYPEFTECRFVSNETLGKASCGGGAYLGQQARARFVDCRFEDNSAEAEGGGIYLYRCGTSLDDHTSGVVLEGCTFKENTAHGSGGGLSSFDSRVRLANVEFEKNSVSDYTYTTGRQAAVGGGTFLDYSSRFVRTAVSMNQPPTMLSACQFNQNHVDASRVPAHVLEEGRARGDFAGGGLCVRSALRGLPFTGDGLVFKGNNAEVGTDVAVPGWYEIPASWNLPLVDADGHGRVFLHPELQDWWTEPVAIDSRFMLPPECYSERESGNEIDSVVLHHISAINVAPDAPYDVENILKIFRAEYPDVHQPTSSHYLIARSGEVYRLVPDDQKAWHAGKSSMPVRSGTTGQLEIREDVNQFSIGIELVKRVDDSLTEQQFQALVRLLMGLQRAHPSIELKNVVGHDAIRAFWNLQHPEAPAPVKEDPGPLFDWARLYATLSDGRF